MKKAFEERVVSLRPVQMRNQVRLELQNAHWVYPHKDPLVTSLGLLSAE